MKNDELLEAYNRATHSDALPEMQLVGNVYAQRGAQVEAGETMREDAETEASNMKARIAVIWNSYRTRICTLIIAAFCILGAGDRGVYLALVWGLILANDVDRLNRQKDDLSDLAKAIAKPEASSQQ